VSFTLSYKDAEGKTRVADALHMTVASKTSLAWLNAQNSIRFTHGDSIRAEMRSYAENGAAIWEPISLAPVGAPPVVVNKALVEKIFFDAALLRTNSVKLAYMKGFFTGAWVALKGDAQTVYALVDFLNRDSFSRAMILWTISKEAYIAVKDFVGTVNDVGIDEIKSKLETESKNLVSGLFAQAQSQVPWAPVDSNVNAETVFYMAGVAGGTIAEGIILSLASDGVGAVTKVSSTLGEVLRTSKTVGYAASAWSNSQKAGAKAVISLIRLTKGTEEEIATLAMISKYLQHVELPSGTTAAERFT
jgi:hypothetical protein